MKRKLVRDEREREASNYVGGEGEQREQVHPIDETASSSPCVNERLEKIDVGVGTKKS